MRRTRRDERGSLSSGSSWRSSWLASWRRSSLPRQRTQLKEGRSRQRGSEEHGSSCRRAPRRRAPGRERVGQADGSRNSPVFQRPGVLDLQELRARSAAFANPDLGKQRQAEDRIPLAGDSAREPEVFKSQQVAALAAGKQNKLWHFVETFYRVQGEEGSGSGAHDRRLPPGHSQAGVRAEPLAVERRPQRNRTGKRSRRRCASG